MRYATHLVLARLQVTGHAGLSLHVEATPVNLHAQIVVQAKIRLMPWTTSSDATYSLLLYS